jgi:hypothetical protein
MRIAIPGGHRGPFVVRRNGIACLRSFTALEREVFSAFIAPTADHLPTRSSVQTAEVEDFR